MNVRFTPESGHWRRNCSTRSRTVSPVNVVPTKCIRSLGFQVRQFLTGIENRLRGRIGPGDEGDLSFRRLRPKTKIKMALRKR